MKAIRIIETALLTYFGSAVLYTLLPSIAGLLATKRPPKSTTQKYNKIAVLVPSYKEDNVIVPVVKKHLTQQYPQEAFDVIVIADSLQQETVEQLQALPIKVVIAEFEQSTKTKSLVLALESFKNSNYDLALICDADNIMEEAFLSKINEAYNAGYHAIQGRRVAKNLNTPFAILDATSEIINNHIYRKGFNALGLSSSLIGSGMAFHYQDLLECLAQIDAVGGFDRVLQLYMIEKGHHILYLESALIFDEKVENSQAFTNQRKRWMSSQFVYLRRYFNRGMKALFRGNLDYFNASVLYNIFLPRIINLGLLSGFTGLSLIFRRVAQPRVWIGLLSLNVLSLVIAIPRKFFTGKLGNALLSLPQVFLIMFRLLFKLKGADQKFIHTKHTQVEVDDNVVY